MSAGQAATTGSEMGRRIATGVLLAVAGYAALLYLPVFTVLVLVVAIAALYELSGLSARKGQELVFVVAAAAVSIYIVLAALGMLRRWEPALVAATIIGSLAVSLFGARSGYFARSAYTLLGVLYIGKLLSYFVTLRLVPHDGLALTAIAILLIATTDIACMLVGVNIGRTQLSPISPRKTVEGALGGLAIVTVLGSLIAMLPAIGAPWWHGAFVGAITGFAAQAGDLVESALKRDALVKDTGTAMGGHGGVLDRFDSYFFGGVAFYGAAFLTGHIPGAGAP